MEDPVFFNEPKSTSSLKRIKTFENLVLTEGGWKLPE
jgi:hypothetical protein